MLSWHNNPALKAEVVERMREHRRQDTIIQGVYQRFAPDKAIGYRGCAIGCTLPVQPSIKIAGLFELATPWPGWHEMVEREYAIPLPLGYLIDSVFESLPQGEHAQFAVDVIEAIPVGKDLMPVAVQLLQDLTKGMDPENLPARPHKLHLWIRDRFLHHLRALEPAPPLIQHIDIPEPESILIRTVVNN